MGHIIQLDEMVAMIPSLRNQDKHIVLANGAFDLLHVGHIRYLQAAKQEGDCLIVAINSDASVKRLKGVNRPVVPEHERAEMVAAVEGVDWVLIFSEDTVLDVLERLRPDVHAKGTDYSVDTIPEAKFVQAYGGRVAIVGDPKNHSTTSVVQTLRLEKVVRRGVPLVISAPSGAGKTTLCHRLLDELNDVEYSISHTTRKPRGSEQQGVDYHFIDDAGFDALLAQNAFLEWAHVFDHRYGTSLAEVERRLSKGIDVLFDIDVQGGQQIKERIPEAVLVFILPPDMPTLQDRLQKRATDSAEQVQKRLQKAQDEIGAAAFYDYWLVNDDLSQAVQTLKHILEVERIRLNDKNVLLQKFFTP